MRLATIIAALLTTALAVSDDSGHTAVTRPPDAVRQELDLDPLYVKHLDVGSLPIVASAKVSDHALAEAAFLIERMIGHRPEVLRAMRGRKTRFVVMAATEFTTDIPEHSDLEPPAYWNRRARGLGATDIRPAVSTGEENLLGFDGDPYSTECILVHEFAHAIHEMGLVTVDPGFDGRLRAAYESAIAEGRWKGTYAATNRREYWAEGAQSWFDTNRENDDVHNHVDTREELIVYDPGLAALCREVFGKSEWRYTRPKDRAPGSPGAAHLAGHDFERAPKFSWPPALRDAAP